MVSGEIKDEEERQSWGPVRVCEVACTEEYGFCHNWIACSTSCSTAADVTHTLYWSYLRHKKH